MTNKLILNRRSCLGRQVLTRRDDSPWRLVQFGAGAGDRNPAHGYRDGFTEYVKAVADPSKDCVYLVEANPLNIQALQECWSSFSHLDIEQVALLPTPSSGQTMTIYWAEADGPHFGTASVNEGHVRRHFPDSPIHSASVPCLGVGTYLTSLRELGKVDLLATDLEGIDAEILLAIDWVDLDCEAVSYEHVHLGKRGREVANTLRDAGLVAAGVGLDHEGFDRLFVRPRSLTHRVQLWSWELERRFWRVVNVIRPRNIRVLLRVKLYDSGLLEAAGRAAKSPLRGFTSGRSDVH